MGISEAKQKIGESLEAEARKLWDRLSEDSRDAWAECILFEHTSLEDVTAKITKWADPHAR